MTYPVILSTRLVVASLGAMALAAVVFVAWPGLDLSAAGLFAEAAGDFGFFTPRSDGGSAAPSRRFRSWS